jgi:hypothetical protein
MMNDLNLRVKVSGDLCHRSGYVQSVNDSMKKDLSFAKSTSKVIQLSPGTHSLTIFVGARFERANTAYSIELLTDPSIHLHAPGNTPICSKTVGTIGFVVIDFTLS